MTFRNKSILIACSDKKDRLQFFNYFDDLAAEKIFTATDYAQMHEMLSQEEENFDVLAFEISPQWVKNIDVIKQIKNDFIDLKLVGLVTKKINMTPVQHSEIGKYVDQLFFSPVTQQELLAKGTALQSNQQPVVSSLAKELDNYLSLYFQLTSIPKVLIDVVTGHVVAINDSFVDQFNVNLHQLDQQNWHQIFVPRLEDNPTTLESKLNEVGHYSFDYQNFQRQ